MINLNTLTFLSDLAAHNDRDWFHANKARYEKDVKAPFEAFVGALIERVQETVDPHVLITPKQAIFRIYRDTRFSADKAPYKTHVSAIISPFGAKSKEYPGFYLQAGPDKFWLGGGAYFLEKETLHRVRSAIAANPGEFVQIISSPAFVKHYGEVLGEKNKRLPEEFQEPAKTVPLLANKQFYYMAQLPAEAALGPGALDTALAYYEAGKALTDFLAQAMTT